MKIPSVHRILLALALVGGGLSAAQAADVFVRFKVVEPAGAKFRVTAGGYIHVANWRLPDERVDVDGGQWSRWLDLRGWPLHGRLDRVGGVAEWPAMSLTVTPLDEKVSGTKSPGRTPENPIMSPEHRLLTPFPPRCALEVQLADKPDPASVVISFREQSASQTVVFLLPHPLREKKGEFESGSQMTARHLAWAQAASGGRAPGLKRFDVITSVWGHYDPELARQTAQTLRLLGFNVMGGVPVEVLQAARMRTYAATWHLVADPEDSAAVWNKTEGAQIDRRIESAEGHWTYENMAHYVIADEIQTMDFRAADRAKLDRWFREYLRAKGETDQTLGRPIDGVSYPAEAMYAKSLPRDADLATRKVMYYAAKFGQWWSVKQLRQTTDLVRNSFARHGVRMKTETLPSDHSFFNAWGPPACGMGYRGLDLFEIGAQEAVDVVSAEDWMGLNHMYGPGSTWTGAMAFGYLSAIYRSGIGERNVALRALITPSDDGYLRLKAYSALAQGTKSFFFWTFGPTYIGTENYWSDLESEYRGIAKLTRALEKAEPILYDAKPARDPVAILYSVSHDQWHTDQPAAFVENRLTWVALRHLGVQPDFVREEDVEAGRLAGYKALYVTGECLTRKAAQRIDDWVRAGGVVYLCAGAATRDEFFEPHLPAFAAAVWPADAAAKTVRQTGHAFNERVDLPTIEPITTVTVRDDQNPSQLKVLGMRLDVLPTDEPAAGAKFADGKPAARVAPHGKGKVVAVGFMPGLAYSPFKPGQTTLDEQWSPAPRRVLGMALAEAGLVDAEGAAAGTLAAAYEIVEPAGAAGPIETSLLSGPQGSAIVLVNHGYKPIRRLRVSLRLPQAARAAVSTEGAPVEMKTPGSDPKNATLDLPLEWADIVLLPKR